MVAVEPAPPRPAEPEPASLPDESEASAPDPAPPHAALVLRPTRGSRVEGRLLLVQLDDELRLLGAVTGLARNTTYILARRNRCLSHAPDDASRRSDPVIYGVAIVSARRGVATVLHDATGLRLDGPLSMLGAFVVVSRTVGGSELACGRVGDR